MNLYLPIEVLNREFQSKLLLAMESATKGMNVYLGRLKPYLIRNFFVPGIILDKSITPTPNRLKEMEFCKKKNFFYTSLDEEVGLVKNNFLKLRYSNQSLKLVDKVFCWGNWDYDLLRKKFSLYNKKFFLTGNPRIDFWRKDFNILYKDKEVKYENYILFSLNFSYLISKSKFKKMMNFYIESKYFDRGLDINKIKKVKKDSFRMYKEFSKLIVSLAKKTNLPIIVRPHPNDPEKNYNFLKKFKNVRVVKKGNISDWIHHAKLVVHSGCTGGFESSIRGYPTISYSPFASSHGHKIADKYSIKIKNLNKCINVIRKIYDNDFKIKKINLKKVQYRAHNVLSNKPSYKIIVDEFVKLMKLNKFKYKNNDLLLNFQFKLRDFRSKLLKLNYGNIKFKIFDQNETKKTFNTLKKLNPKFNDLKISFIKKDIIRIKLN